MHVFDDEHHGHHRQARGQSPPQPGRAHVPPKRERRTHRQAERRSAELREQVVEREGADLATGRAPGEGDVDPVRRVGIGERLGGGREGVREASAGVRAERNRSRGERQGELTWNAISSPMSTPQPSLVIWHA